MLFFGKLLSFSVTVFLYVDLEWINRILISEISEANRYDIVLGYRLGAVGTKVITTLIAAEVSTLQIYMSTTHVAAKNLYFLFIRVG